MNTPRETVVPAIVGPTASGKTAISLILAERLGAEIISVDSRQVYRYLDIGADKVSHSVRKRIIHHMLDVADPDQVFSAADFANECRDAVRRILARGRIPLCVGGTPFYYQAFFGSMLTGNLPKDEAVRIELEEIARERGKTALHALLEEADPESAARLHPNDVRRVVRALEIHRVTGRSATEWYRTKGKLVPPGEFKPLYIGLTKSRPALFRSIEQRVREQFASGFPEEVEWLLANGYDERFPSMQGFGYKDILECLRGRITLEDAAERDISQTKAFSRRQMTWFSKFSPIVWYDTSDCDAEEVCCSILDHMGLFPGKGFRDHEN